jgi:filamentous hemagglutinin family protein
MKIVTLLGCLTMALLIDSVANRAIAQMTNIVPDKTLSDKNSTFDGTNIAGGVTQGKNLFHSFEIFNIGDKQQVDFLNLFGAKNIITRVTGRESSKIDGTLSVQGGANLFFLNPNGISFGSNARLDMTGTFVGSTATGLKFDDNNVYGTDQPQVPLLTMTTPIGLQFGRNPGAISLDNSRAFDSENGYKGSSLILVGGNINLDKSKISLPGGKIELVAIGSAGNVNLDYSNLNNYQKSSITVPLKQTMADIILKSGSRLRTTGIVSGDVILQARDIEISGVEDDDSNRSVINTRPLGQSNSKRGGSVMLNATNDILIQGNYSGISTSPQKYSDVDGGSILINAQNLRIRDGAYIETSAYKNSLRNGGDIILKIVDTLELNAPRNGQQSEIASASRGFGKAGNNIDIHTGQLIHQDGAQIYTDPTDDIDGNNNSADGKLGDIRIVATNLVEVSGVSVKNRIAGFAKPTGITSFTSSAKRSGNIEIQTPHFLLKNGASISAGTDSSGAGGLISVTGLNGKNAESVELVGNSGISKVLGIDNLPGFSDIGNGSRIRNITSSSNNAGSIVIRADQVTLRSGTRIDVSTLNQKSVAGSINIQTKTLELLDGGQLISTTKGSGQAGSIQLNKTDSVTLIGVDEGFATKKTFFNFINAVNSQSNSREALNAYLNLKSPTDHDRQNLLSALKPNDISTQKKLFVFEDIDQKIIIDYFKILATDPLARQALREYLPPITITDALPANLFINSSKNSGIVSRVLAGATGNGGNIDINVNQILLLRNQSQILATAASGKGGNVTIQAPAGAVVAVPNENSEISASASTIDGTGGRVEISALNVLGFSTKASDRLSSITADGGTQGVVTINTIGADPNKGLQPKQIEPGAPEIAQDCQAINNTQASKLANSGKGGITPNPSELIPSSNIWTDPNSTSNTNQPVTTITAAKGWTPGQGRTVILTSQPNGQSQLTSNPTPRNCHAK